MQDIGSKIKGSLQVVFIGVLSRFSMAGIPFWRPPVRMAFRKLLIHHFDDFRIHRALADEGPDDVCPFGQEPCPFVKALLRVFRPGICPQGCKECDLRMVQLFEEGLGFGIGRAAVYPCLLYTSGLYLLPSFST